jgi:hypothetical protein
LGTDTLASPLETAPGYHTSEAKSWPASMP